MWQEFDGISLGVDDIKPINLNYIGVGSKTTTRIKKSKKNLKPYPYTECQLPENLKDSEFYYKTEQKYGKYRQE